MREIQGTAREGEGPKVAELISQALESFGEQNFERTAALAAQAKLLAPRSICTIELLGLALYYLGRWKDALRELLTYRRLTASLEQNHLIADCYRALQRPDRALEVCSEVRREATELQVWTEIMLVAAGALSDQGDLPGALAMLRRADQGAATVEEHHLRLWYFTADLLQRSERRREAAALWQRIAAEDPDFFDVQDRLVDG
ncbi:MAG: hypothetical protein ACT4OM_02505 [Actinomycetota bacterium]